MIDVVTNHMGQNWTSELPPSGKGLHVCLGALSWLTHAQLTHTLTVLGSASGVSQLDPPFNDPSIFHDCSACQVAFSPPMPPHDPSHITSLRPVPGGVDHDEAWLRKRHLRLLGGRLR